LLLTNIHDLAGLCWHPIGEGDWSANSFGIALRGGSLWEVNEALDLKPTASVALKRAMKTSKQRRKFFIDEMF